MKKIISVLLTLCLCFGVFSLCASAETKTGLRFGDDGTFTILHLTDPQDDAVLADGLVEFIEKAIETAQPDLIVLTGDLVEDNRIGDLTSDDEPFKEGVADEDYATALANVESCIAQIFAPLEKSGIPYAVTQGNNDYKAGISNEDWLRIYAQYPNCITIDESPDANGKIDTYFEILSSDSDVPAFGIWMLDNGKGFTDEQISWMQSHETSGVPGIVFEHIPVDDIGNLFEKCSPFDEGAFINDGMCLRLNGTLAAGHAEYAHEPGITTDAFKVWKEKNVIGAFFGHEHTSGFTGTYDGITMGLTYGCQFAKAGSYGMRTITIDQESGTFTTDLYTYSDGTFTLQVDEPYAEYDSAFDKFLHSILNFFKFLFNSLSYMLKF